MSGATRDSDFESELERRFGPQSSPSISLDATSLALTGQSPLVVEEVLHRLLRGNVERYVRLGEVARGGMGRVDRVWDRDLRRELAMKLLLDPETGSPRHSELTEKAAKADARAVFRFVTEAQVTGQLHHPGIVPVHEIGFDADGRLFFTMRLIRGQTLLDVIQWTWAGHPDWNQQRGLRVLLDVCDAVAYAHSRGVIHRDLKPSNVMVGGFGETYVMDWGLARVLQSDAQQPPAAASASEASESGWHDARSSHQLLQSASGSVVGTPAYMAPEQASGRLEALHAQADVYSVGAMLYHLLAGNAPYMQPDESTDPRALLERVQAGPPLPLSRTAANAPAELIAICERAMARDPAQRYRDMQEMAADLRAFLDQRVVRAYRTGAWAEISTWVRRNRAMATAAAIALLAVVAGLGSIAWITRTKNAEITAARDRAQKSLDDVRKLAALKKVRDLRQEADEIWPAWPAELGRMRAWLDRAHALLDERADHERSRQSLLARTSVSGENGAKPHFADAADAWWYESLVELFSELDELGAADPTQVGTVAEMEKRVGRAETIEAKSVGAFRSDWSEAIEAIAADPRFGGLELIEQMGLVPIGPDPDSKLWEFWVVETGEMPERDPSTGHLMMNEMDESMGVVLVLLPGDPDYGFISGFGSGPDLRSAPNKSERAPLVPFFASKFEMSQAQWQTVTGRNPSFHSPNSEFCFKQEHSLLCPVETVAYPELLRVLRSVGLRLPTAAQWQYAARAGTSTPWWTGDRIESMQGAGNLRDRSYMSAFDTVSGTVAVHVPWIDGFSCCAPIGRFRANPFGLHDTVGNVYEVCLDRLPATQNFRSHRAQETGEYVVDSVDSAARDHPWMPVTLGQSFRGSPENTIGEIRLTELATKADDVGVRPVRLLDR